MRILLITAACFILFFSCSKSNDPDPTPVPVPQDTLKSGWVKYPAPAPHLTDVAFSTLAKGYVSSGEGMYQSIDSGKTWSLIPASTGKQIATIRFLNSQYGYCIGTTGTFGYTSDGGNTWNFKNAPPGIDVQFLSPAVGFVAGQDGLFKTTDSGNTWTLLKSGMYYGLHFIDEQNGWATSQIPPCQIYSTTNGGMTWNMQYDNGMVELYTVQFINSDIGWATSIPKIAKTTDGGASWQITDSGFGGKDIEFLNSSLGYKANGLKIQKSIDGGQTWTTEVKLSSNGGFIEHIFLDADHGWAVGQLEYILRYSK